jgi:hypothetical protein
MSFLYGKDGGGAGFCFAAGKVSNENDLGEFPVFAVAEVNPPGPQNIDWSRIDSTLSIQRMIGQWEASFYWAVCDVTGVIAVWKRDTDPCRMWVFKLYSDEIENEGLSPEDCVEIGHQMVAQRAPDMGTRPDPDERTQAKYDEYYSTICDRLDELRLVLDDHTVVVNERGVNYKDVSAMQSLAESLPIRIKRFTFDIEESNKLG